MARASVIKNPREHYTYKYYNTNNDKKQYHCKLGPSSFLTLSRESEILSIILS
jgi:hypothetical protein